MSYKATKQNIVGPKTQEVMLVQELEDIELNIRSLQVEIDRPIRAREAMDLETIFGEEYLCMSNIEKENIQEDFCDRCFKYVVIKGDRLVPGKMESFARFFGMCKCMWKRYVASTYIGRKHDPFDMNDYNKITRYEEWAVIARRKMIDIIERRQQAIDKLKQVRATLAHNDLTRNNFSKHCSVVNEETIKNRLEERQKQIKKNKQKMKTMQSRKLTTSKKRKGQGCAKKQSYI